MIETEAAAVCRRFFLLMEAETMEVCTLASGSSGNSLLVRSGETNILIDAGISARRITTGLKSLGVNPEKLSAILVTHAHSDHISGLATLTKKLNMPIFASADTAHQICCKIPWIDYLIEEVRPGEGFELDEMWCQSFATPHDAPGSMGYSVTANGCKVALATDLGHLTQSVMEGIAGSDLLVAEANHDEEWVKTGPYPPFLKQRILGDYGHLSNETGALLVQRGVELGARTVLLAHLSSENNTPARARNTVARHLHYVGIDPERDLELTVAPRSEPGKLYRLERGMDPQGFSLKEAAGC